MESNKFEQDLKKRMSQYESPMDLDQFWFDLEPKLKKKKNRYGLIIIISSLACLGGIFLLMNNDKINGEKTNSSIINKSKNDNVKNTFDPTSKEIHNQNVNTSGDLKIKQNEAQALIHSSPLSEVTPNQHSKINSLNKSKPVSHEETIHLDNNTGKFEEKTITGDNLTNQLLNPEDDVIVEYADQNSGLNVPNKIPNSAQVANEITSLNTISCDSIVFEREKTALTPLLLEENNFQKNSNDHHISLLAFFGIGWYSKRLHAVSNDHLSQYIKIRNQHEKEIEELNFGLHIQKQFGKIGLLSGLEYKRMNEKFYYEEIVQKYQFGTTAIRVEHIDTSYLGSGQAWYKTQLIRKLTHYNTVQQWNIPIGLSYQLTKKPLRLNITAGIICSISNQITGMSLDRSLKLGEWNHSEDLQYDEQLGLGWFSELSVEFPFTKHLAWTAGFKIQEFPGNYSTSQGIDLRFQSYTFSSGIQIRL